MSSEMIELGVKAISEAQYENSWFTPHMVVHSFASWGAALSKENIEEWLAPYQFGSNKSQKVGIIMAGNIPLVGLHDLICALLADHEVMVKVSSKDRLLMNLLIEIIGLISNEWKKRIRLVDSLKEIDILIATGSDNSARYFDYYFRNKRRLIRKNRTSIAILNGNETEDQLSFLADDVFMYFGLGCRNVTKLYLPEAYDLNKLFKAFFRYKEHINHNKYANNYDYNKVVYLLNQTELLENGFIVLKEDKGLHSPVGVLFYEYYSDLMTLLAKNKEEREQIQCLVGSVALPDMVPFGRAQQPDLWNYADNVDTLSFLLKE